jgi:ankyrin repeat protein
MDVLRQLFQIESFKSCMNDHGELREIDVTVRIAMNQENIFDGEVILRPDDEVPATHEVAEHKFVPPICIIALWNAHVDKVELIEFLVEQGADLHRRDEHGRHLIHFACLLDCQDVVKYLIDQPLDLGLTDMVGNTPLHYAVLGAKSEMCRLLLDSGARWDTYNTLGAAPLHPIGNLETLKVFVEHGVDVRLPSTAGGQDGKKVHVAPCSYCTSVAARGHSVILKYIHETYPGIFREDANSFEPLVQAMLRNRVDCAEFLLGVSDLNETFKDLGMNALHCAGMSANTS